MDDRDKAIAAVRQLAPWRAEEYQGWFETGAAMHSAGCTLADFIDWSKQAPNFSADACERTWNRYSATDTGRNVGSLVQWCREDGGTISTGGTGASGFALDWDSEVSVKSGDWLPEVYVPPPSEEFTGDLLKLLRVMFRAEDIVGYATKSWCREGKWLPADRGGWRPQWELQRDLIAAGDDIGSVVGDYELACGAWLRINPLDGNGVADKNITDYRYALVESDSLPIDEQYAVVQKLELPCVALIHSGGKSLHAIVKIDAPSLEVYRERVEFLFSVCAKHGLPIDRANKNPSRLFRMPGCFRGENKQYLIATDTGQLDWDSWDRFIDEADDELPDFVTLGDMLGANLPPLKPELIQGLLREGHKLIISGPSKGAKSFALIQLCIAFGTGRQWMGRDCKHGRCLYVNLELDEVSGYHRFNDVLTDQKLTDSEFTQAAKNVDIWTLRGHVQQLEILAPKLIRRAKRNDYVAVVIDPIYKLAGNENDAEAMTKFGNLFDHVGMSLGCSVIYCHHHSKGSQGHKRAEDRSSGSGVFSRDPDAVLDLVELEISDERRAALCDAIEAEALHEHLNASGFPWRSEVPRDHWPVPDKLMKSILGVAPKSISNSCAGVRAHAHARATAMAGFRLEAALREFARPSPTLLWFSWPVHVLDTWGLLDDAKAAGELSPYEMAQQKRKSRAKREQKLEVDQLSMAIASLDLGGQPRSVKNAASEAGVSEVTIRKWLKKSADWACKNGIITQDEK